MPLLLLDLNDPDAVTAFILARVDTSAAVPGGQPSGTPDAPSAMSALLPFDDALARLLSHADTLPGTETIDTMKPTGACWPGRWCPRWMSRPDNAQMDGYAVRAADLAANPDTVFPVSQRIPAGHQGQPLQPGTVARGILIGAVLPPGADAVVMQEEGVGLPLPGAEGTGVRFRVQPASPALPRRGHRRRQHRAGRRHSPHSGCRWSGCLHRRGHAGGASSSARGMLLHR